MATIDKYAIQIDVTGQQQVDKLKAGIDGLKTAIASVGVLAFMHSVMQLSDEISDLADATGLSIAGIARFRDGLAQAGGRADDAGKMIAKFFQSVDSAAQGTESAQKALDRVGITFKDIGSLSESELINKALYNLAKMEVGAARTAAGMEVFGKSFRNIDPKILKDALDTGDFTKAEQALKRLADIADRNAYNFNQLQIAAATVFDGAMRTIEPFIGKMDNARLSAEQAEKIMKAMGVAITLAFGAGVISSIMRFNTALGVTAGIAALIGASPVGMIAKLGAALLTTAAAGTAAYLALDKLMQKNDDLANAETPEAPSAFGGRKTQFYSDAELQARKQALIATQETTKAMIQQNREAQKYQQIINGTVGMLQDEADLIKLNASLDQDAANKKLDLEKQIQVELGKGRATNQDVVTELRKQITEVDNNLKITKALKAEELLRLQTQQAISLATETDAKQKALQLDAEKQLQQLRIRGLVVNGEMTEAQAARQIELENAKIANEERMQSLRVALAKATTQAQIDEIQIQISDEQKAAEQRIQILKQRQEQEIQLRQSGIAGAKDAMEQLARSMDPYAVAQNRINSMWNNMSTALDNFVETGKFNFRDFASSIIKDLLKIELKASAMKMFQAMGSGGGFLSGIGSLFGFANGGNPPIGKPSIVGENGPELIVPRTATTVIPNGAGQQQAPVYNITNNISAVDGQSVARLFANNRQLMLGTIEQARKELPVRGMR